MSGVEFIISYLLLLLFGMLIHHSFLFWYCAQKFATCMEKYSANPTYYPYVLFCILALRN